MGDAADDAMYAYGDELLDSLFRRRSNTTRRPSILEDFGTPARENTNMSIRDTAQAQLQRNEAERQRLLTRLAILDQFGAEDPWENETVLQFNRNFGGPRSYLHVALRSGGVWYVTGSRNTGKSFTWDELVEEHLAKSVPDSIYVVTGWEKYA